MSWQSNLNLLKKDFEKGRHFTLFVGAGVNAGANVKLLWNDLVREACEFSFRAIGHELNLDNEEIKRLLSVLGINKIDLKDWGRTENSQIPDDVFLKILTMKDYANTHFPVEIQVSIIKSILGYSYIPFLQNYLYNQCNKNVIRKSFEEYKIHNLEAVGDGNKKRKRSKHTNLHTLYVVARMILLNPQIKSVITYNFDNFLSYSISYLLENVSDFFNKDECDLLKSRYGVNTLEELRKIYAAVDVSEQNKEYPKIGYRTIPIYHVHGYIPAPDEMQNIDESSIILSMDEFCTSLRDSHSWKLTVQETAVLTSNCLFIGDSMTDLSNKRIMDLHRQYNSHNTLYMLGAHNNSKEGQSVGYCTQDSLRKLRNVYLESMGVKVIDCDKGFDNLYSEIKEISSVPPSMK